MNLYSGVKGVMYKILIVDDDVKLAQLIQQYLGQFDYEILHGENGQQGLDLTKQYQPELILLDLMMPIQDGMTVCRQLQGWYQGKIIVLTATGEDMDQVAVLEMGAHDYIQKPVHPRVLLARIRAHLRQNENKQAVGVNEATSAAPDQLRVGNLHLNRRRCQAYLKDQAIALTNTEFDLLWLLANNPEQTLDRDTIMRELRGIEHNGFDRSIDNKILSLRKKLAAINGAQNPIVTIRGKGYLFASDQWR